MLLLSFLAVFHDFWGIKGARKGLRKTINSEIDRARRVLLGIGGHRVGIDPQANSLRKNSNRTLKYLTSKHN